MSNGLGQRSECVVQLYGGVKAEMSGLSQTTVVCPLSSGASVTVDKLGCEQELEAFNPR